LSHGHERSEKVCLNCGASLYGLYCHVCGQENVEPKEKTGQLIRHFLEDITHFDGKFFGTLKFLITKLGFLSAEYMAGRRAHYLHPIRLYMFVTFVFFFVFFTFAHKNATVITKPKKDVKQGELSFGINRNTDQPINITLDTSGIKNVHTQTLAEYEARQDSLPRNMRDNILVRYFQKKNIALTTSYQKDTKEFVNKAKEKFYHSLPQMFFVVLPIFALLLSLLYIRQRNNYNYVAHAIFTVHFYCMIFIYWLVVFLLMMLPVVGIISALLFIIVSCLYLYRAMRRFYGQGGVKTFLKFTLLNLSFLFIFVVLLVLYVVNAASSLV